MSVWHFLTFAFGGLFCVSIWLNLIFVNKVRAIIAREEAR